MEAAGSRRRSRPSESRDGWRSGLVLVQGFAQLESETRYARCTGLLMQSLLPIAAPPRRPFVICAARCSQYTTGMTSSLSGYTPARARIIQARAVRASPTARSPSGGPPPSQEASITLELRQLPLPTAAHRRRWHTPTLVNSPPEIHRPPSIYTTDRPRPPAISVTLGIPLVSGRGVHRADEGKKSRSFASWSTETMARATGRGPKSAGQAASQLSGSWLSTVVGSPKTLEIFSVREQQRDFSYRNAANNMRAGPSG